MKRPPPGDAGFRPAAPRWMPAYGRRAGRLRAGTATDVGFTLVEVLVAIAVIGTTMTALAPFFNNSLILTGQQRSKQTAIQVAADAMERVRAVKRSAVLAGRGPDKSAAQWTAGLRSDAIRPHLESMKLASDPLLLPGSDAGDAAPLPTKANRVVVNGLTYEQNWYVGRCRQQAGPAGSGDRACENPDNPDPDPTAADAEFLRVVVAVTWSHRGCPGASCTYVTSTLISTAADPVFNTNRPPPKVNDPGDQFGYLTVPATLRLTATGGRLPLSWTATGLPSGLTMSPAGLVSGTPTTLGEYTVTVTVKDRRNDTDDAQFKWTIGELPRLTSPGDQVTRAGTQVSLPIQVTGGFAPLAWTAAGLPAGLSINPSTGVITGVPTTYERKAVTVTVTDRGGKSASVTFSWRILTLALPNPGTQTTPMNAHVDFAPLAATGGSGRYTWRAENLPYGLAIDPNTGRISGYVWAGTRYITTVYVRDSDGDEVSTSFIWNAPPDFNNDLRVTYPDPANPDQVSRVGQPITPLIPTADRGSSSGYTWTVSGLPPGLTMTLAFQGNKSTPTISGTPTVAGTYVVTLKVTDAQEKWATMMFVWTVR